MPPGGVPGGLLPWLNPVYRDESLKRFPNYDELWTTREPNSPITPAEPAIEALERT